MPCSSLRFSTAEGMVEAAEAATRDMCVRQQQGRGLVRSRAALLSCPAWGLVHIKLASTPVFMAGLGGQEANWVLSSFVFRDKPIYLVLSEKSEKNGWYLQALLETALAIWGQNHP